MSDKQLTEETKVNLIKYVAALLKSEKGLSSKPFNAAFKKAMSSNAEGFTTTTAELITNQTQIMEKQVDHLAELLGATEQKIAQIDKQQQTFQLANLVLTFVYYGVLVAVKGLMLMHYLTGSVVRDEWVDTIALTFLFVYPYIIYPIEYWLYSAVAWVVGLVYNTTKIPDMSTLVTGTNAYAPPVDLDSDFIPTA